MLYVHTFKLTHFVQVAAISLTACCPILLIKHDRDLPPTLYLAFTCYRALNRVNTCLLQMVSASLGYCASC